MLDPAVPQLASAHQDPSARAASVCINMQPDHTATCSPEHAQHPCASRGQSSRPEQALQAETDTLPNALLQVTIGWGPASACCAAPFSCCPCACSWRIASLVPLWPAGGGLYDMSQRRMSVGVMTAGGGVGGKKGWVER
jgi:hypothetical protein